MDWLDRLERRFGFLAVPHLALALIAAQALAYFAAMSDPSLVQRLVLDPAAVFQHGEWWRILSYVLIPNGTGGWSLFFAIFWFMFLWMMVQALEAAWSQFKVSFYFFFGLLLQSGGALLLYALGWERLVIDGWWWSTSLQLAFATLFPDFTIYVFFILPLKMRWWAWLLGAWCIFRALTGGPGAWTELALGLGNYALFFGPFAYQSYKLRRLANEGKKVFVAAQRESQARFLRTCTECGRGLKDAELRLCLCERCGDEGRDWCTEHLTTHLTKLPKKEGSLPTTKEKRKTASSSSPSSKRKKS